MRFLVIILSIHIFSVQTKLIYLLTGGDKFSYLVMDEPTVTAIAFSISYAISTAWVLYKTSWKRLIMLYAILDAFAVLLYYLTVIPIWVGSFYFAIYTFVIIASTYAVNKPEEKQEKFSQRKLAAELGISESKLSRVISKVKTNSTDERQ